MDPVKDLNLYQNCGNRDHIIVRYADHRVNEDLVFVDNTMNITENISPVIFLDSLYNMMQFLFIYVLGKIIDAPRNPTSPKSLCQNNKDWNVISRVALLLLQELFGIIYIYIYIYLFICLYKTFTILLNAIIHLVSGTFLTSISIVRTDPFVSMLTSLNYDIQELINRIF